jgi:hypothetical protein
MICVEPCVMMVRLMVDVIAWSVISGVSSSDSGENSHESDQKSPQIR